MNNDKLDMVLQTRYDTLYTLENIEETLSNEEIANFIITLLENNDEVYQIILKSVRDKKLKRIFE